MNKYSKLSKVQMLNICKLINPDCKWEFNQLLDNDGKGTDDCYEFLGDDESCIQFNIHQPAEDEIRCYLKGNWDDDEIPVDKIELVNKFLGIETVINKQDTKVNSNEIKKHYVLEGEIDKFTKIAEYEMSYPGLTLESQLITEYIQSKDELAATLEQLTGKKQKGSGNSSLRMELIYRHKAEQDILIIKLELNLYALHLEYNESILKGAQIFLLIDDNNTLDCGKIIDYKAGAGSAGFGLEEKAYLETDFAFLAQLANANKLEYRVVGKRGKISEGEFSKSDVFRIKGFYNGLFDPEFMKDELLEQIELDKAEKQRKEEKRKIEDKKNKINENDEKILNYCKQGKKLEAVKFRKETSGADLATSKKYVEDLCEKNGVKVLAKSSSNCFVITATMGDPYHPIVDEFRTYRDRKLLTNEFGKAFVSFYYKVGPYAASIISKSEILRKLSFSFFVNPIYKRLKNDRNTNKN
jgi:hypothetical protein